jgi:membrane fusion protein (multidrug efflux system)
VHCENKDGKLLPGTFADELPLDVIIGAIVIPTQADSCSKRKKFYFDFGKAKEVMVETATRTDASLLILSD